jgi:hypothetical protein
MDGNVMKKLEEMGRIKVIKKPKYKHDFTKNYYQTVKEHAFENLNKIRSILEKHQNKVKIHITGIGIEEIKKAYKYYFNLRTNAENTEFNRRFLKNYKEIENIVLRTPGLSEAVKKEITEILESVKKIFVDQLNYIKNFEEDIISGKIKPSQNPIEIIKLK